MFKHAIADPEVPMSPATQPVLFVSHGAPTLALEGGAWAEALHAWAVGLEGVRAILVLSAHWESAGPVRVLAHPRPDTLHDFGGFPEALYRMQYPAPGDPDLAARVVAMLQAGGMEAGLDPLRPLDHGVWVPLRAAFPEARIPVVQVSLPIARTPHGLFELGRLLAPLRQEGVVVIASGGIVHNLRLLDGSDRPRTEAWAQAFEDWVVQGLARTQTTPAAPDALDGLFSAAAQAPFYARAVPTTEHFDPLYFAMGAAGAGHLRTVHQGWQYGSLSLRVWDWAD
jgi:4,5-DOPA dioxygenase extradiol